MPPSPLIAPRQDALMPPSPLFAPRQNAPSPLSLRLQFQYEEDVLKKVRCNCGGRNCSGWMC